MQRTTLGIEVAKQMGSVSHLLKEGKSASIGAAGGTGDDRGSHKVSALSE